MKEFFGKSNEGTDVYLYTLENKNKMCVKITNYGGTVCSILFPDKEGKVEDLLLGFSDLNGYLAEGNPYFGCLVGRFANRINQGIFTLDGVEYKLAQNDGPNHLHGGIKGFDKVVWESKEIEENGCQGIQLTYFSKDGEEGYPGNLSVSVSYILTGENELKIKYEAETDKATPLNLTNHCYFNLCGNAKRDVLDHEVKIFANAYTPVNENLIPTGELAKVEGGPFDFREFKKIGQDIVQVSGGYDHNFVLNLDKSRITKIAEVVENISARVLEVFTSEPGVQLYTGNFLDGSLIGKEGFPYKKHFGFCLETQHFPDSPNCPEFPNVILKPGEKYTQETSYKFSIRD